MTLVAPDSAEELMLNYILNISSPSATTIRLFKNDLTPDHETVVGDITESTETGYAAISLPSWSVSDAGGGVMTAAHAAVTFTFTAAANVYGYYVTNSDGLLWIERFTCAPAVIAAGGGEVPITPQLVLNGSP